MMLNTYIGYKVIGLALLYIQPLPGEGILKVQWA